MLCLFGAFANFAFYQAFLTGIYNFGTRELLEMRSVPFPIKAGLSTSLSFWICWKLWDKHVYEQELYAVAVKYRGRFDPQSATTEQQTL